MCTARYQQLQLEMGAGCAGAGGARRRVAGGAMAWQPVSSLEGGAAAAQVAQGAGSGVEAGADEEQRRRGEAGAREGTYHVSGRRGEV